MRIMEMRKGHRIHSVVPAAALALFLLTLALAFLPGETALAAGVNEPGYQFPITAAGASLWYEVTEPAAGDPPGEVKLYGQGNFSGALSSDQVSNSGFVYKVTQIGDAALANCTNLTSVSLSNVTRIGNNAFQGCTSLASVSLPNVTAIGSNAFLYCAMDSIALPKATAVGNGAFQLCANLTSVSLPEVTGIGDTVFYGCTNLTSVDLPEVASIGDRAFSNCEKLRSVPLSKAASIGINAFYGCAIAGEITLPELISIGSGAFSECDNLTKITMPKLRVVEEAAFYDCANLKSVVLPEAEEIGPWPFQQCTSLASIDLPKATSIGENAFYGCTSLASVNLPSAVSIGDGAFRECASLTDITLPNAKSIGLRAFRDCHKLTSANLPKATGIGEDAFQRCSLLTSVTMGASISPGNFDVNAFRDVPPPLDVHVPLGMGAYYSQFLQGGANPRFPAGSRIIEPAVTPTTWTMPKAFKATKGFSYQLVKAQPDGRALPSLTYKLSNKKASVDANGVLTAKTTGTVTVKATDASGASVKCKVTVVANKFTRKKPLMLKGGSGLYASTKRLYYKNKKLYAEVFVYNRTKASMQGAGPLVFQLRDGNTVLCEKPIPYWCFKNKLKNKRYKVYKLTIKEEMLGGVGAKAFDLGTGGVQALLIGEGITPLTAGMDNVTKPKGAEALLSVEPIDPSDPDLFGIS